MEEASLLQDEDFGIGEWVGGIVVREMLFSLFCARIFIGFLFEFFEKWSVLV